MGNNDNNDNNDNANNNDNDNDNPDSKGHGANMGPTWVLSAPGEPHVGPMNLVIREYVSNLYSNTHFYNVPMSE